VRKLHADFAIAIGRYFDFSMDGMTADKAKALKESLSEEFSQNQGSPNHLKNFCDTSLVLTEAGDDIVAQPRTFYMGFFSGLCLREVFACTPMLSVTPIMLFVKMIMLAVVLRWPCFLANSRCVRSGNGAALDPMVYSA